MILSYFPAGIFKSLKSHSQLSLCILLLCLSLSQSSDKSNESSAERIKRQLYREQIPHHRPLSGNIYALHAGFPHPSRWHVNQGGIVRPHTATGFHFDNPNVILNDEDFNKYGSTLQHLDDHRISQENIYGSKQVENAGHEIPVPVSMPVMTTHTHIHHHGNHESHPFVEHGHTVLHSEYEYAKPRPIFSGFKSLFNSGASFKGPKFSIPPFLKGFLPGRYGGGHSSYAKRKGNHEWAVEY